jgi:DNA modification methylase
MNKKGSIHCNDTAKNEKLQFRTEIPADLHWQELAKRVGPNFKFLGEIYNVEEDKYYSQLAAKKYRPKLKEKHLDVGPYAGYRFAIEHLTKEDDWIFDPCMGSGTAAIEAINNGRNAVGIELEYPNIAKQNVDYQKSDKTATIIEGNALHLDKLLPANGISQEKFDLIVTGTPYPVIGGGKSSDAPQRKAGDIDNYYNPDSFGLLKWDKDYRFFIDKMYVDSIKFLKKDGFFCTIIKDPTQNKEPFMLQKHITNWVRESNPNMIPYGFFIHKHVPTTFFMNTYAKMYPEAAQIPMYQIGLILQKK